MFSVVDSSRPQPGTCANCGQPLTGPYCIGCGEKALRPESLTVSYFVRHVLADELLHLDGKIWRTLRALVLHPAVLSAAYTSGRRRAYVNPVRLLVTAIIVYALATQGGFLVTLTIGPLNVNVAPAAVASDRSIADTMTQIDRFGVLHHAFAAKAQSPAATSEVAREHFHQRLNQFVQPVSFTNVLLLALALYVMFHRRRTLFLEHLVFSMHFVTFVLLSSLALFPGIWLIGFHRTDLGVAILLGITLWQFAYVTVALRRFYALGRTTAVAAAVFIYLLNSAFVTVVQMIGVAIALQAL